MMKPRFGTLQASEGTAIVLVSHDLSLVGRYTARLLVMYAGRIVEHGPTREVLQSPRHPYTRALLATGATLHWPRRRPLPTISGTPPGAADAHGGCVFRARCACAFERCATTQPELPDGAGAACLLDADTHGRGDS